MHVIPNIHDYVTWCIFTDSQPFQEFEQGATGQDLGTGAGLNALRLDDDNEFPPMTHKVD